MSLNLQETHPHLYETSTEPTFVEIPSMRFLMLDGQGAPDADEYHQAIQALYPVAYRLKFCLRDKDMDFEIMPLETLWWAEDEDAFREMDLSRWHWTTMLRIPETVCDDCYHECWEHAAERSDSPSFGKIRMEDFEEGRAAQVLHVGPYADERPTIEKLHAFIVEHGERPEGKHHEIYLSDPRETKPAKLHTVIRQPVG